MDNISWSDAKRIGIKGLRLCVPVTILVDGKPEFILCKEQDIIVVSDLHIRVRNMLKAMEKRARAGMPKPQTVELETE